MASMSVVVAIVASSYGIPTPTCSPNGRGWEAYERVSNLGVGMSTLWLPGGVRFGGVAGPRGDVWVGVSGRVGRGLRGGGVKRPPNRPLKGGVGKNSVCVGVRKHVAWIAGLRIWWSRSWETNVSRPLSLAMRTNSSGHFAGERTCVASSDCLCAGTNCMCPAGIRMRVDMLRWPHIAAEFHGVSSQTERINTTKKGVSCDSAEKRA